MLPLTKLAIGISLIAAFWNGISGFDLTIELKNKTTRRILYNGSNFPDVSLLFGIRSSEVIRLSLTKSNINCLNGTHLGALKNLKSLTLNRNARLRHLRDYLFVNNPRLVEINLNDNSIETISPRAFSGVFPNGDLNGVLFINGNKLQNFPSFITSAPGLKKLYLDENPLIGLSQDELKNLPQLRKLFLRRCQLLEITDFAFKKNTALESIDLSDNPRLVSISSSAFEGVNQITYLNLSNTGIKSVPHKGLNSLEILSLKNSDRIWKIDDEIVQLPKLRLVEVPHARRFLCCAFIYERKRIGHYGFGRGSNRTRICTTKAPGTTQGIYKPTMSSSTTNKTVTSSGHQSSTSSPWGGGFWLSKKRKPRGIYQFGVGSGFIKSNITTATQARSGKSIFDDAEFDFGTDGFLPGTVSPKSVMYHCDNVSVPLATFERTHVRCIPGPDALRPCDDIMGNEFLSGISWIVSLLALLSNAIVFGVLVISRRHFTVTKFLITNLAFADMCLGLYLFVMICASTHTHGSYYNYVISWQFGAGCKVAGFLAIFSSQLSMLILTVITTERYLAIVYAVYLNKRLHMRNARVLCIGSWLAATLMAFLPLVGINSYNQVALCLPFQTESVVDLTYIGFVLTFNTVLFVVVFLAYFRMYQVVRSPNVDLRAQCRSDSAIARRMSVLVFTDFACWAPIAVIGLFAAAGYNEAIGIDVKKSKYLLVIFFPINSICNPFLYALSTKSFRREFFLLLASCGFCEKKAYEYTGGSFFRRSKLTKETRNSETQSTVASRRDGKLTYLMGLFKRNLSLDKLENQLNPQVNNGYPMKRNQSDHFTSPDTEETFTESKPGPSTEASKENKVNTGIQNPRVSFPPETNSVDTKLTPCEHSSENMMPYFRSVSGVSCVNEEALLIKDRSKVSTNDNLQEHRL